jgi:hypothetical protein
MIPKANRRETYLLTAGHCIKNGGAEWNAFNQAGEKKRLGNEGKWEFDGGGDFGDIFVEPKTAPAEGGYWANFGNPPTFAVMARWGKMGEEISQPVVGESGPPIVGTTSCHEGQTSGESCGEIKATGQSLTYEGETVKGLVKMEGAMLKGQVGDSGGPWFAPGELNEVYMKGIFVATAAGNEKVGYFEPLETIYKQYAKEGQPLELLTTKNEARKPEFANCAKVGAKEGDWETSKCTKEEAEGEYEKEKLATTAKVGLTLSSGETMFEDEDKGGIKCTKSEGSGEISGPTEVAKLKPVYKGCEETYYKTKCKSGTVEGEVVANPLRGTPVYLDAALTKVGLLLEAEGGGALAKFKCGVYEWEITGSFMCPITPKNEMTTTYTVTCNIVTKEGFQRQEWRDVEEKTPLHEIWLWLRHGEEVAGAPAAVGATATVTSGEAVEINAGSSSPTVTSGSATGIGEKEATFQGTVNPEGTETKYYFEYGTTESYGSKTAEASAGSGASSVEVSKTITGLTADTKYHYRLVATNSNGTTYGADQKFTTTYWSAPQEPPPPTGAKASHLEGVSCMSSITCVAVGEFSNSSGSAPLAEKWNGTAWSAEEPKAPTGDKKASLRGVSCTSSTACVAVGEFMNSSATWIPLAEKWNGTAWSAEELPLPTGALFAFLNGVSCTSSTACVAVGEFWNSSDRFVPWAEKWNGTAWSAQELPLPTGVEEGFLYGVSCTSSTACAAVGEFEGSGEIVPLAEKWNGTAWSAQKPTAPTGAMESQLSGVSCASSTECAAVGEFENGSAKRVPLAEQWNGTAWSDQEPPAPTGAQSSHLYGVSCTSSTACTAGGRFENSSEKFLPLVDRWNGTAWSAQEPPAPTGAKASLLYGVSCTSSTECTAVGYFENSSSTDVPLAERYE